MIRVGFVGGADLPGNVRTLLRNVRRLLSARPTEFDCELIVDDDAASPDGYRIVDPGVEVGDTARAALVGLVQALRRYVRERQPDVLFQVTRFPTHGTATAVAGRLTGTPTVARLAGANFEEYRFAESPLERARLFGLKNCVGLAAVHLPNAVVVLGPQGRTALRRRLRRRHVHEVPQPVDTDRFSPVGNDRRAQLRSELGMPADETRVLLTVGRVSRRKGMADLRETAYELDADGADVRWYVVGEGPMRADLRDVSLVETVGRVDHDRMPDYYRAADLYVHPSLHEGLPNALLEATACGTPSVARDVGECALVACETFDSRRKLLELLLRDYSRVELDSRLHESELGKTYERLLRGVAT